MFDIGADLQRAYEEGYRKGKEDEHRWWTKLCADCDGVIDEPQTSKIIEAYAKGWTDGADAVKNEPQTDIHGITDCDFCKHRSEEWDSEACDGCCENNDHFEPLTCRNKDHYADCEYKDNCNPVVCFKALDEFREMVTEPQERSE